MPHVCVLAWAWAEAAGGQGRGGQLSSGDWCAPAPCPLARGKWDSLPLCTGTKHKLTASCLQRNERPFQQLFSQTAVPTIKEFSAEGVALATSVSLRSEKWQKQKGFVFTRESLAIGPQHIALMHGKMVSLTTHIYAVLLQGLYLLQRS